MRAAPNEHVAVSGRAADHAATCASVGRSVGNDAAVIGLPFFFAKATSAGTRQAGTNSARFHA